MSQAEARLREAAAHGFKQAYLPRVEGLAKRIDLQLTPDLHPRRARRTAAGLSVAGVTR